MLHESIFQEFLLKILGKILNFTGQVSFYDFTLKLAQDLLNELIASLLNK
jgi:hypothetical protein